jgi:hypothetical protein
MQSIQKEPVTLKLPLVDGYTCSTDLVIKNCPNCGRPHFHGDPFSSYQLGDKTTRVPHCRIHWDVQSIVIEVVGEISRTELRRLELRVKPFKEKAELNYIDFDLSKIGSN